METLQATNKLSEVHLNKLGEIFDDLLQRFKRTNIQSLQDDEIYLFTYFVHALSSVAKTNMSFYSKLNEVLKLDFLPLLIAKSLLSKNPEIIQIAFKLSAIDNFPNKKVANILAQSEIRGEKYPSTNSPSRQGVTMTNKYVSRKLSEDIEYLVQRMSEKLANNEINNANTTDILQLYRTKIDTLNDHLTSVTSSLDRSTTEVAELTQKIATFRKITEKQEFMNWCLQLDKERMVKEVEKEALVVTTLKDSIQTFQEKLSKETNSHHDVEKKLRAKIKEIEGELGGFWGMKRILIALNFHDFLKEFIEILREFKVCPNLGGNFLLKLLILINFLSSDFSDCPREGFN